MEKEMKKKTIQLLDRTRVMTLAVSKAGVPWSSPVYFVFQDKQFYFFSNENSQHVLSAMDKRPVSVSVFHDSDKIDEIFGIQMAGEVTPVTNQVEILLVIKKYVTKFGFLKKIFGPQILENKNFFLEKFKSTLYSFNPNVVFLSDNSKTSGKRSEIDLYKL